MLYGVCAAEDLVNRLEYLQRRFVSNGRLDFADEIVDWHGAHLPVMPGPDGERPSFDFLGANDRHERHLLCFGVSD